MLVYTFGPLPGETFLTNRLSLSFSGQKLLEISRDICLCNFSGDNTQKNSSGHA